jgi:hypothetical protein
MNRRSVFEEMKGGREKEREGGERKGECKGEMRGGR